MIRVSTILCALPRVCLHTERMHVCIGNTALPVPLVSVSYAKLSAVHNRVDAASPLQNDCKWKITAVRQLLLSGIDTGIPKRK